MSNNNLKNAVKAVREAIIAKQTAIDNETDLVKKDELIAELKAFVAEAGLVFDGDAAAAQADANGEGREEVKESFFTRAKAWMKAKAQLAKEHKVKVAVGVATVAAAVAAGVYASRNPGQASAFADQFKSRAGNANAGVNQDQFMSAVGGFFSRTIGAIGNGLVAAKDWIVGLFRSNPSSAQTTATVTTTVDLDGALA